MKRWLHDLRIFPVLLVAVIGLFGLKATGLLMDGSFSLGQRLNRADAIVVTTVPASPATQLRSQTSPLDLAAANPSGQRRSWAQEMFNYPDVTGSVAAQRAAPKETVIVTGSVGAAKEPPKEAAKPPPKEPAKEPAKDAAKDGKPAAKDAKAEAPQAKPAAPGTTTTERPVDLARAPDPSRATSPAERAILERLVERRQELDARARELELRENLLKAAEKELEAKLASLKGNDSRAGNERKDPAEAARFKGLITMYETMKPKDAAKIFDRLEMKVLLEVATQINPRRMSEIMALMTPESAEKLTIEFAARGGDPAAKTPELPKIEGKPTGG